MAKNESGKSCSNCKYFEQHYAWTDGGFRAVNCGHCKNKKRSLKESISFSYFSVCALWEDGAQECAERKGAIIEAVKNMSDRIEEIEDVFGCGKENL